MKYMQHLKMSHTANRGQVVHDLKLKFSASCSRLSAHRLSPFLRKNDPSVSLHGRKIVLRSTVCQNRQSVETALTRRLDFNAAAEVFACAKARKTPLAV